MFRCFLIPLVWAVLTTPVWAAPPDNALPTGDSDDVRARLSGWNGPSAPVIGQALAAPVTLDRLSSPFGLRVDPLGRGLRPHEGIDVPGVPGTPVRAAADGVVVVARASGDYGNLVEIDHGGGVTTRYGHLRASEVAAGMTVRQGEVIGLMGSTGRSTGSHLHFEVRLDGRAVDPLDRFGAPGRRIVPPSVAVRHGGGWEEPAGRLPTARLR